ncbi:uncharacterized protein TRIVIDRAFT_85158 [Trichoderma virens Gv29-8]|uniref:Uncharacterized protein n=1 Tax=Hypocrea virens (strain Gv29-8 / FGSC 10586) TaxID=413071 RepID=G9MIR0_HYPVG|nr:uncharacterized protein TRIVIDRAFT_85158 [Trichoderma virens Gv29-8]EHK25377.1 hypothetical protein TRIVIDRAFT_85158 [Trichoderma virens Gv29-8]
MRPDDSDDGSFSSLMTTSMVATFLNTTSSPVSPGPSSPSFQMAKSTSFVPPARPSSTPFPHPETRSPQICCLEGSESSHDASGWDESSAEPVDAAAGSPPARHFEQLPTEVHEAILDHIFGYCVSATSRSTMRISSLTRGWSTALRHSRRRELTALALVNRVWSVLVQQRLFRHIKLKATLDSINNAMDFLVERPHLSSYIKHIEIWFPVFQPTYGPLALSNTLTLPTVTTDGLTNATYTLPGNNCTLEQVFQFVAAALPETKVLTLEGGERRKAPRVVHFDMRIPGLAAEDRQLLPLTSVSTLVTKGQWNLMRDGDDFKVLMKALPNLEEWQGSYSKPKSKSYITASDFLPLLPNHVTNLSLCMESDYRREGVMPAFYYKVAQKAHLCSSMARILPSLEHFAYTGRVCHHFFDAAMRLADPLTTRLKSIDITVKNCCRQSFSFHESGSGIQDMAFIEAFEKLVVSAVRSMDKFKGIEYLRIRFVDLDSVLPPLNPYFLMQNGKCTGVWSDFIINEMNRVRPNITFPGLSDTFGNIVYSKDGRMIIAPEPSRPRITSLKLSNYRSLATRITIQ